MPASKTCSHCEEVQPLSEFYAHKTGARAGSLMSTCKQCQRTAANDRYARRKAGALVTMYVHEQECGDCRETKSRNEFGIDHARATGLKRYCGPCIRNRWFIGRYGITADDYFIMLEAQDGVCAICKQPERTLSSRGKIKPLSVDHDHATGEIRGLLCDDCNVAIGRMHDDPSRLTSAILYLTMRDADTALLVTEIPSNEEVMPYAE